MLALLSVAASLAQVLVYDPQQILSIPPTTKFTNQLISYALYTATNQQTDGTYANSNILRTNYFNYTPCATIVPLSSVPKSQRSKYSVYPVSYSTISGIRDSYFSAMTKLNYVPATGAPAQTCTTANTLVFAIRGQTTTSSETHVIASWIVVLLVIAALGVSGFMIFEDDEAQDDETDDVSLLLYHSQDMVLCDESCLDDEPWEDGGVDY